MTMVYLIIGSILGILLAIKLIGGGKYLYMLDGLDSDAFPLRVIYGVGLSWMNVPLFALKGKMKETLVGQAKLLYDVRYAEYYASIVWAQVLSFAHLCLTTGFLLAGIMESGLMLFMGLVFAVVFGYYFINRMQELLKTREAECTEELPEIVSTMALLINAGMMLRNAWYSIAESKEGTVYALMRQACSDMENGMSEIDAINKFGRLSNSAEIRKFTSALTQSIERGGSELTVFLSARAVEMWALKKQLMLQKGEAAATKLLMPTLMLFGAVIIAVLIGAFGMLI